METEFYDRPNVQQSSESQLMSSFGDLGSKTSLSLTRQLTSERQLRDFIETAVAEGNYAVAIASIDRLIAMRPNSAMDYNNRGLMYFRNNQINEALADLSLALQIDPKLDSAYNNRANCYAAKGELVEAISDYDVALDLNPANIRAWINQGITFRELGMYDLAIENFEIALVVGNSLPERIYAERGRTYHLRGDWNCAVADYQFSLKLLSDRTNSAVYRQKVQTWLDELLQPLNRESY
jgi:tetratricopeptide (TPR) repeat protein